MKKESPAEPQQVPQTAPPSPENSSTHTQNTSDFTTLRLYDSTTITPKITSTKDLFAGKLAEAKQKSAETELEKNSDFTLNELQKQVSDYAEKADSRLKVLLQNANLGKEGNKAVITVANELQHSILWENSADFCDFLKNKLQNTNISLEIIVNEAEKKKMLFSAKEKYDAMLKKQPFLAELRRVFAADIEL